MQRLNIGKEFSPDPAGRYKTDGDSSGEYFREKFLKPKIQKLEEGEKIEIVLDDGVEGYGSSFLVEGFAGMVKYGYITSKELLNILAFKYQDEDFAFYKNKIISYIQEAQYNSMKY